MYNMHERGVGVTCPQSTYDECLGRGVKGTGRTYPHVSGKVGPTHAHICVGIGVGDISTCERRGVPLMPTCLCWAEGWATQIHMWAVAGGWASHVRMCVGQRSGPNISTCEQQGVGLAYLAASHVHIFVGHMGIYYRGGPHISNI